MKDMHFLIPATVAITVFGCAFIWAMLRLPQRYRRPLITGIVFVSGLYYSLEYFIPTHVVASGASENFLTPYMVKFLEPFTNILGGLAFGVGIYSIFILHYHKTVRRQPGWIMEG
jgi:hypothetical protein